MEKSLQGEMGQMKSGVDRGEADRDGGLVGGGIHTHGFPGRSEHVVVELQIVASELASRGERQIH